MFYSKWRLFLDVEMTIFWSFMKNLMMILSRFIYCHHHQFIITSHIINSQDRKGWQKQAERNQKIRSESPSFYFYKNFMIYLKPSVHIWRSLYPFLRTRTRVRSWAYCSEKKGNFGFPVEITCPSLLDNEILCLQTDFGACFSCENDSHPKEVGFVVWLFLKSFEEIFKTLLTSPTVNSKPKP